MNLILWIKLVLLTLSSSTSGLTVPSVMITLSKMHAQILLQFRCLKVKFYYSIFKKKSMLNWCLQVKKLHQENVLKSRNEGRGVTEQSDFTSYVQDTLLVLHPWLEDQDNICIYFCTSVKVQSNHDSILGSFLFSGKARLTWQKQDLPGRKARLRLFYLFYV